MQLNYEGLIPLLGGLYFLLAMKGVVKFSSDPAHNEKMRQRLGKRGSWLALAVMGFGLLLLSGLLGP